VAIGPREGSLYVAEQLALEQRLGHGRAVDGDERSVAAPVQVVNRSRHQLLAGPGLAGEEDGHAALAGESHPLEDLLHRRAAAHQAAEGVLALRLFRAQRDPLVAEHRRGLVGEGADGTPHASRLVGQHPHLSEQVELPAVLRPELAFLETNALWRLTLGEEVVPGAEALAVLPLEDAARFGGYFVVGVAGGP